MERRPNASKKLNGKATMMLAAAIKTLSVNPPHKSVLTVCKPNQVPSSMAIPTNGNNSQATIDPFMRMSLGKTKEAIMTAINNNSVRLILHSSCSG